MIMGTKAGAPPIKIHVAFVPAAGEAAGPPIVSRDNYVIRTNLRRSFLHRTRNNCSWRAGGLAGLLRPAT